MDATFLEMGKSRIRTVLIALTCIWLLHLVLCAVILRDFVTHSRLLCGFQGFVNNSYRNTDSSVPCRRACHVSISDAIMCQGAAALSASHPLESAV